MKTTDQLSIDRLLSKVVDLGATDLHLSAGNPPTVRMEGKLRPMDNEQLVTSDFLQTLKVAWVGPDDEKRLQEEREVIFTKSFKDRMRFRIHVLFQQGFPSFSLRYLSNKIFSLDELNLAEVVKRFPLVREGLILVGGAYGSGRTTTLVSLLDAINHQQAAKIVTLEDPVEVLIPDHTSIIDQREIGKDVRSISDGLDRVVGEDVDVVAISELLHAEEMKKALEIADSGRLVLSTVNGASFFHLMEKIVHQFSSEDRPWMRELLSRTLAGVITQKFIPKQGGGRVMATEVVMPNDSIRALIREGNLFQLTNIVHHSREQGIFPFDQSLADLVNAGLVSMEDAESEAMDREGFRARMNLSNESF